MNWLKKEAQGKGVCNCILLWLCFNLGYSVLVCTTFILLKMPPIEFPGGKITIDAKLFLALPIVVLIEEVLFRGPLICVAKIRCSLKNTLIAAAILSMIFGLVHGLWICIFIQGVAGFGLSLLFLKCGGLQGRYIKAITATTTAHVAFDAILLLICMQHGMKEF